MDEYLPCPKCGSTNIEKVRFTMWGGIVGSRLLNHVKCVDCGEEYNGRTGGSNTARIVLYDIIAFALAMAAAFLILW